MKAKNLKDTKFDRLLVQRFSHIDTANNAVWVCLCACGNITSVRASHLLSNRVKSCGCLRNEQIGNLNKVHGLSKSSEYHIWKNIIYRCTNKLHAKYATYGGRGIDISPSWEVSFEAFLRDMGARPSKAHQIDRIDTNKGYFPGNCAWVMPLQNKRNTRTSKWWYLLGVKFNAAAQAAEFFGVTAKTIARWCDGRHRNGKFTPPEQGCYSEYKYAKEL